MNGRPITPVWYDGKMYESATQASIQLNYSVGTIYAALATGFLNGKEITRTEPRYTVKKKEPVKVHRAGEPLIPHPETCGISTIWK